MKSPLRAVALGRYHPLFVVRGLSAWLGPSSEGGFMRGVSGFLGWSSSGFSWAAFTGRERSPERHNASCVRDSVSLGEQDPEPLLVVKVKLGSPFQSSPEILTSMISIPTFIASRMSLYPSFDSLKNSSLCGLSSPENWISFTSSILAVQVSIEFN